MHLLSAAVFEIWTNIFRNSDKFILSHFKLPLINQCICSILQFFKSKILTNTFSNLEKYILQFWEIHFAMPSHATLPRHWSISKFALNCFFFWNLNCCSIWNSKSEQIHFAIWTNTFFNLENILFCHFVYFCHLSTLHCLWSINVFALCCSDSKSDTFSNRRTYLLMKYNGMFY